MTETRMNQHRLAIELRLATDQAMTIDPARGPDRAAMKRVKRLLTDYPGALAQTHVTWNLGTRRLAWLRRVQPGG